MVVRCRKQDFPLVKVKSSEKEPFFRGMRCTLLRDGSVIMGTRGADTCGDSAPGAQPLTFLKPRCLRSWPPPPSRGLSETPIFCMPTRTEQGQPVALGPVRPGSNLTPPTWRGCWAPERTGWSAVQAHTAVALGLLRALSRREGTVVYSTSCWP